mgnify:CR=1 FL=1
MSGTRVSVQRRECRDGARGGERIALRPGFDLMGLSLVTLHGRQVLACVC